jgi:sigma-B regulation protein RsbU (phosphoserine phosphatase)
MKQNSIFNILSCLGILKIMPKFLSHFFWLMTSSIKARIMFALVGLSVFFIVLYIFISKKTFENDKIAYVFEAEQNQAHMAAKDFSSQIEKFYFLGKSLLLTYNPSSKKISPQGQSVFDSNKQFLMMEMIDEITESQIVRVGAVDSPGLQKDEKQIPLNKLVLYPMDSNKFLILSRELSNTKNIYRIRILIQNPYEFPKSTYQTVFLVKNNQILQKSGDVNLQTDNTVPNKFISAPDLSTFYENIDSTPFLISKANIGFGDLSLYILTPESILYKAMKELYRKSMAFLVFTIFSALLLAFLLAHRLTNGIYELTNAANEIAKNNFNFQLKFKSKDEMGQLASAFRNMITKIQILLKETALTARMQSELETAKTVQDTLFPKFTRFEHKNLKLTGKFLTASECGGDWWWYWRQGDTLFVIIADATGHGAPAALLTSAARSAVSLFEINPNSNILKIAWELNHAIESCGNGLLYMSAFILEIDLNSYQVMYINCSHIGTIVMPGTSELNDKTSWKNINTLVEPSSKPLGRKWVEGGRETFDIGTYQLKPGERLLLLTDGITECKNKRQELMNDRTLYSTFLSLHKNSRGKPNVFLEGVFENAIAHIGSNEFEDDLTAVVIERSA